MQASGFNFIVKFNGNAPLGLLLGPRSSGAPGTPLPWDPAPLGLLGPQEYKCICYITAYTAQHIGLFLESQWRQFTVYIFYIQES